MTDRGSEFVAGTLENLCESYHIEIENLPAYRPDLKGVVEKLFDLIQSAYKPLLKGKGVIESDTQERGAPDYRRQGTLDLEQFTAVVLRCLLFYNAKSVQAGFTRTPAMIEANTPPLAASIWSFCEAQDDCPVHEATDKKLLYTLLPRAEGKSRSAVWKSSVCVFQTALLKSVLFLPVSVDGKLYRLPMRRNVWIPCGCLKTALTRLLTWCKKPIWANHWRKLQTHNSRKK